MAMNLGNANLKHVNISRPELVHSSSQHSITASDHYYSASENSTNASSADDRTTVIRYHTPIDRTAALEQEASKSGSIKNLSATHLAPPPPREGQTPEGVRCLSPVEEQSPPRAVQLPPTDQIPIIDGPLPGSYPQERSTPDLRSAPELSEKGVSLTTPTHEKEVPLTPLPHEKRSVSPSADDSAQLKIPRKAVASSDMSQWQGTRPRPAPTPGVDDTPYIHFAIDQLTRDEELLGQSRDASGSPDLTPPDIGRSLSPLSHNEDELRHPLAHDDLITPLSQVHRVPQKSPSISPLSEQNQEEQEQALPHEPPPQYPPRDLYRYPPLTFVPASLRLPAISILALVCLAYIALLVLSVVWSIKHQGLWLYDGIGTGKYFLAEYLPQLLAVLLFIYVQVVQSALQRILPFVLLARPTSSSNRDVLTTVPLYVTNYLTPNMSLLRSGRFLFQYASISFWLSLFTVPLASALYQTRLYTATTSWRWATVQPVGIILIAIYANLTLTLFALSFGLRRGPTGLKWDPVSLVDVLVLLRRSSMGATDRPISELFRPDHASLGYWESSSQPGDFYHGIGHHFSSTTRLQVDRGKAVVRTSQGPPNVSTFESWRSTKGHLIHPRFLRETYLILYASIAAVLLIAFLAASYVHNALMYGFSPQLATATPATASFSSFSPSNFLYSFVPALIGLFQPLLWQSLDTSARFLAPYLALVRAGPRGVPAEASVLLSYAADSPFVATVRAKSHGHNAVAASSALSLLSWALPVIGGGIFTAQFVGAATDSTGQIVIRADPAGLGALTAFVVLCGLGWILAWPVTRIALQGSLRGRRRVRTAMTEKGRGRPTASVEDWLGETDVRFLAGIRDSVGDAILASRVWREPRTREDLVGRLVGRGRGRWSWNGDQGTGAVQRFDV